MFVLDWQIATLVLVLSGASVTFLSFLVALISLCRNTSSKHQCTIAIFLFTAGKNTQSMCSLRVSCPKVFSIDQSARHPPMRGGLWIRMHFLNFLCLHILNPLSLFSTVVLQSCALVLYPIKFIDGKMLQTYHEFNWGYGLGWGATIFMLGGGVLLCLRTDAYENGMY